MLGSGEWEFKLRQRDSSCIALKSDDFGVRVQDSRVKSMAQGGMRAARIWVEGAELTSLPVWGKHALVTLLSQSQAPSTAQVSFDFTAVERQEAP